MNLTDVLLSALRAAAGPDVRSIGLASTDNILLTHSSGAQLMVNVMALAPHIQGDPGRLMAEVNGALAALSRLAVSKNDGGQQDIDERLVPIIRSAQWLVHANAQASRDLLQDGLVTEFGTTLFLAFAVEYRNRRVPVIDWPSIEMTRRNGLIDLALANQRRMIAYDPEALIATNLQMGDGTFFLRSKNLQAASLILQPSVWELILNFAPQAPKVVVASIVCADVVAFGPAEPDDLEGGADLLRSAALGLRKSFGGGGDWGNDVFVLVDGSRLPKPLPPKYGSDHSS